MTAHVFGIDIGKRGRPNMAVTRGNVSEYPGRPEIV